MDPQDCCQNGPVCSSTQPQAQRQSSQEQPALPHGDCALQFLSADELATRFDSAVLVDVRPFSDYTVGHIRGAVSVRLSSILIRRLAGGKISCVDIVIDEQKQRFRQLSADPASLLVVYDENAPSTTDANTLLSDTKAPLSIVAKSLCRSFPAVAVLQASFSAFQAVYPHLVDRSIADEIPVAALLSPPAVSCAPDPLSDRSPCVSVRDTVPSEILPYLYVGSQSHASSKEIVQSFRFTHILNITSTCPNRFPETVVYKTINIRDTWNQNIASYFEEAFSFIDSAKNAGGKVLVHCVAGISRSPTITIAYLMKSNGWTLCEALSFVKGKRTIVSPNLDFLVELQSFERQLYPNFGPLPPITSPDTHLLLGPGYPCVGACAPVVNANTDSSCLAGTMAAMDCEALAARAAVVSAAPQPAMLSAPFGFEQNAQTQNPPRSSPLAAAVAAASALSDAPPLSAGFLPPQTPWVLSHAGSAPSLLLPPATAGLNPAHVAHPLSYGTSTVSPALEARQSSESIGRRSGSISEGCSPRIKSPFQVSLSAAVARTSPKSSRRDPQSPFVPSPTTQGIFAL